MSNATPWDLVKYRPLLRLLARGLLRDVPLLNGKIDQSDLTNDALLKAHQGLAQFRGTTEAELLSWLRAILANEFNTLCRRYFAQARDPALEKSINESLHRSSVRLGVFLEASQASPSELAQQREAIAALTDALETLSPAEYEALVAHEFEGETYRQIAARLNVSPSTVLKWVRDALKKLRTLLGGHDSEASQ